MVALRLDDRVRSSEPIQRSNSRLEELSWVEQETDITLSIKLSMMVLYAMWNSCDVSSLVRLSDHDRNDFLRFLSFVITRLKGLLGFGSVQSHADGYVVLISNVVRVLTASVLELRKRPDGERASQPLVKLLVIVLPEVSDWHRNRMSRGVVSSSVDEASSPESDDVTLPTSDVTVLSALFEGAWKMSRSRSHWANVFKVMVSVVKTQTFVEYFADIASTPPQPHTILALHSSWQSRLVSCM